jgi:uncharacterized protein (DUF362 family)
MQQEETRPIVSIARVKDGRIDLAVEEAIDLLGGIEAVTSGKQKIMLKPNLAADDPKYTTKPEVIRALARLLQGAGKEVSIGEGAAGAGGINAIDGEVYRSWNTELLERLQQQVFDRLGYTELAASLGVPLVNLHLGEMVEVVVPQSLAFETIRLHHALTEIDLLCSVPMMKTHVLATVTLGMKNLIGLYPGGVYGTVRGWVHDRAAEAGSPGIAYEIVDMVRANKLGLVVIDGTTAMEGDGPTGGELVDMGLIVAGTNPLATDMLAAHLMGFDLEEVPTFTCAQQVGMRPQSVAEIEVRGEPVKAARRPFKKPNIVAWTAMNQTWGVKAIWLPSPMRVVGEGLGMRAPGAAVAGQAA